MALSKEKLRYPHAHLSTVNDILTSGTLNIPPLELPKNIIPKLDDLLLPAPGPKKETYQDDWRICPNCGLYYVKPHTCMMLGRKRFDAHQGDS